MQQQVKWSIVPTVRCVPSRPLHGLPEVVCQQRHGLPQFGPEGLPARLILAWEGLRHCKTSRK